MHYYIDGYNLLFRSAWKITGTNLEKLRTQLIQELDTEVSLLPITVTIVFDAPLQNEDLRRSHFRSLEIIFTSQGQTADDFLISLFRELDAPKNATLVSSDRDLQKRAKLFSVKSQSIEDFLTWLRKRSYKKRIISEKPEIKPAPKQATKLAPKKNTQRQTTSKSSKEKKADWEEVQVTERKPAKPYKKFQTFPKDELPSLSDFHLWEQLFEARLSELNRDENKKDKNKIK